MLLGVRNNIKESSRIVMAAYDLLVTLVITSTGKPIFDYGKKLRRCETFSQNC